MRRPRRVTPETAICQGLATLLRLACDARAGGGEQGPPAVVESIIGVSRRQNLQAVFLRRQIQTAKSYLEEDEMEVEDAEADSSKPSGRLDGAGAVMLLRAFLITRCNPSEKVRLPSPTVSTLPNSGIPGSGAPLILAHVAELTARYSIQHTQAKGGSSSRYGSAQSRTMPPARLISILVAMSTI